MKQIGDFQHKIPASVQLDNNTITETNEIREVASGVIMIPLLCNGSHQ
jgi:hypothetical protein